MLSSGCRPGLLLPCSYSYGPSHHFLCHHFRLASAHINAWLPCYFSNQILKIWDLGYTTHILPFYHRPAQDQTQDLLSDMQTSCTTTTTCQEGGRGPKWGQAPIHVSTAYRKPQVKQSTTWKRALVWFFSLGQGNWKVCKFVYCQICARAEKRERWMKHLLLLLLLVTITIIILK